MSETSQQIIVIPQSLLKTVRPVLKVAPNTNATVLKRPASDEQNKMGPVRKRANLDHLSAEEKLMRRKLKNRVAAQNARDKKRAKMDDMEELIKQMEQDRKQLMEENEKLNALNKRLIIENEELRGSNAIYAAPDSPESVSSSDLEGGHHQVVHQSFVVERTESEPAELHSHVLQPKGRSDRTTADAWRTRTVPPKKRILAENSNSASRSTTTSIDTSIPTITTSR